MSAMNEKGSDIKLESWLVSAGRHSEPGAPLNVPMVPASNFIMGAGAVYSRGDGTPSWKALEDVIGGLESGKAVLFSSGMAAVAAVFDQLVTGAVVAIPDDCYQGVAGLAAAGEEKGRWSVQRIPVDDTAGWVQACSSADLIWLESPSNPLLTVADLEAVCKEVYRWPLRPSGWRRHDKRRCALGGPEGMPRTDRSHAGNAGGLPGPPRRQDACASAAEGPANGNGSRGVAREAPAGRARPLPWPAVTSDPCRCQACAQGVRNHHLLRCAGRRRGC